MSANECDRAQAIDLIWFAESNRGKCAKMYPHKNGKSWGEFGINNMELWNVDGPSCRPILHNTPVEDQHLACGRILDKCMSRIRSANMYVIGTEPKIPENWIEAACLYHHGTYVKHSEYRDKLVKEYERCWSRFNTIQQNVIVGKKHGQSAR